MLSTWLYKRKLKKFNSPESTCDYKLYNHQIMKVYNGKELTSLSMDSITVITKCGSVEKLVEVLRSYLDSIGRLESVPKLKNISRDKGDISLTNYLTKEDGYPYPISKADGDVAELLTRTSELLDNLQDEETRYSYYRRVLKPYVTEAIDFRTLVNVRTQP